MERYATDLHAALSGARLVLSLLLSSAALEPRCPRRFSLRLSFTCSFVAVVHRFTSEYLITSAIQLRLDSDDRNVRSYVVFMNNACTP